MANMPIDLATVDWLYVGVLALLAFLSTLIGTAVAFRRVVLGAIVSTVLFTAGFVFWTYYPHHVPVLPTRLAVEKPAPAAAPAATTPAPVPQKPANPITDITPPKNPATTPPPANQQ